MQPLAKAEGKANANQTRNAAALETALCSTMSVLSTQTQEPNIRSRKEILISRCY